MTQRTKRTTLQSEIIRFIQDYIQEKGLTAGDKLPSQEKLIEMMGVSRTSLREAVKTLEAKNILEVRNGKGIYISEGHGNALEFVLDFTLRKESLLELLQIRRALEREILRMAVQQATDEELDELGKVEAVLLDKYRKGLPQATEDRQFHYMIYELSHNTTMTTIMNAIMDAFSLFWSSPLGMVEPFNASIPSHEDLYIALRQRNVKKAQQINDWMLDSIYQEIEENA